MADNRRATRALIGGIWVCSLVGCASPGLADGATPPPSFGRSAEATDGPQRSTPAAYVPQGRDVPAAGVVQHITCAGAKQDPNAPTVVLLAGLGAGAAQTWEGVFPSDAHDLSLRTCMVDRPGVGLSPDRPEGPNSPPLNAQELLAGLAAAGERGPFIFAGWSYGGLVALLAAGAAHAADPASVAGLVLIDPTLPDEYRTLDPEGWEEGDQELDMAAGEAAAATVRLGDAPVVVLVAGDNENNRDNWDLVLAGVRDVAGRSADFVVVDSPESSHDIAADDPEVILAALRTVVQAAGGSMPDCPPEFGASDEDWGCLAADGAPAGQQRSD